MNLVLPADLRSQKQWQNHPSYDFREPWRNRAYNYQRVNGDERISETEKSITKSKQVHYFTVNRNDETDWLYAYSTWQRNGSDKKYLCVHGPYDKQMKAWSQIENDGYIFYKKYHWPKTAAGAGGIWVHIASLV